MTREDALLLNILSEEAHTISVKHGWWSKFQTIEHKLMLVITEIAEAIEADRINKHADVESYKSEGENFDPFRNHIKNSVEDEFADICIRLLDIAGKLNCDFTKMDIGQCFNMDSFNFSFADIAFNLTQMICDPSVSYNKIVFKSISFTFQWAKILNIDIMYHIREKIKYNKNRPYMHGNKMY